MIKFIKILPEILRNMGMEYVLFRGTYEVKRKMGLLRKKYPISPKQLEYISLADWKKSEAKFFFNAKEDLKIPKRPNPILEKEYKSLQEENYLFFNSTRFQTNNYDWTSNPDTNYKYDNTAHWTEIEDTVAEAGDIKYVWELSRFSFLGTIIRYDYHFQQDCADYVLSKIDGWIEANPINCGPNYKCSQEIGLRVMNWTFALNYYKNSDALTEALFQKIMHHINWQIQHVYDNINFSLKSVRNNHALAETMSIYLVGLLYPFLPNAGKWKKDGKKWFEQEIAYQIYDDGAFLMFSTNYQRTAVQFFTWALYLSKLNQDSLNETSHERIFKAFLLLYQSQDRISGRLPNYGHNDGSLFFKVNDCEFRDFRSQLNAVNYYYTKQNLYGEIPKINEETSWYTTKFDELKSNEKWINRVEKPALASFKKGGYYVINQEKSVTFLRAGSHKDRPSQADNLHLDLWYEGENILRDAGTYKYNTEPKLVSYFSGTSAHNTVTLGQNDQMKKGPRFIWLNWSQCLSASLSEASDHFLFKGKIEAFKHIDKDCQHERVVKKLKNQARWEIIDNLAHNTDSPMYQHWNISDSFKEKFTISATDEQGNSLAQSIQQGYYSELYGKKVETEVIVFSTKTKQIKTIIQLK